MSKSFIGMGHNPNPNVPDIPEGFGAALSNAPEAHYNFDCLSDAQKTSVIHYIQSNNTTGFDAKQKIDNAIESLKQNRIPM